MASKNSLLFSFSCLRKFLVAFNFLLMIFGLLISTLPVYFFVNKILKSWPINGGIIAMGVMLVVISLFGCYGSRRQHQIILFFYMVILGLICLLTFAFSLAALSLSKSQERTVLLRGWKSASNATRGDIQTYGNCCGFDSSDNTSTDHPSCIKLPCYKTNSCAPCYKKLESDWFTSFRKAIGGVALFVSILMAVGIYLTYRYRHFKNPTSDPNEYL